MDFLILFNIDTAAYTMHVMNEITNGALVVRAELGF
jgi:hypothetical protein